MFNLFVSFCFKQDLAHARYSYIDTYSCHCCFYFSLSFLLSTYFSLLFLFHSTLLSCIYFPPLYLSLSAISLSLVSIFSSSFYHFSPLSPHLSPSPLKCFTLYNLPPLSHSFNHTHYFP